MSVTWLTHSINLILSSEPCVRYVQIRVSEYINVFIPIFLKPRVRCTFLVLSLELHYNKMLYPLNIRLFTWQITYSIEYLLLHCLSQWYLIHLFYCMYTVLQPLFIPDIQGIYLDTIMVLTQSLPSTFMDNYLQWADEYVSYYVNLADNIFSRDKHVPPYFILISC